jgi:two-component system, OmpR family, sensor kinase
MTRATRSVAPPARGAGYSLFWPWLWLTLVCLYWMWIAPGDEVVPFHLIWIGFALAYGFEAWPVRVTCLALGTVAVASGVVLVVRARAGVIAWEETSEIVLMLVLAVLVMWHVRRRLAALAEVTRIADHQVAAASERERLARLTSHEMRTPLTIAAGYVDLLLAREDRDDHREDLHVVRDELGRLWRAGDRLLRMIRLEDLPPQDAVDLSGLVDETVTRWATVAERDWRTETAPAFLVGSRERLRVCLDTLMENAVRYTRAGQTIRVFCCSDDATRVWLGVADSGPGFTREQTALLNDRHRLDSGPGLDVGASGPGGQTGYGLGIVREIVTARDGLVRAGRSREGGALVLIVLGTDLDRRTSGSVTASTLPVPTSRPVVRPARTPR